MTPDPIVPPAGDVSTRDRVLARPIIILGAPRSGTTLLSGILRGHGALLLFEEPRLTWRYGNDRKSDMLRRADATPEIVHRIRETFRQRMMASGRTRMCEKTPSNALRLEFVNEVFPDARFIHIMRHGADSVLSIESFWDRHATGLGGGMPKRLYQRLGELSPKRLPHYAAEFIRRAAPGPLRPLVGQNVWGPRIPGVRGLLKDLDILDIACLQWRMCVEAACAQGRRLPPERYHEWHLEDMSKDLIRSVLSFCELEEDPGVWRAYDELYDPSQNQRRKRPLSGERGQRVFDWIGPTLQWLGYDAEPD